MHYRLISLFMPPYDCRSPLILLTRFLNTTVHGLMTAAMSSALLIGCHSSDAVKEPEPQTPRIEAYPRALAPTTASEPPNTTDTAQDLSSTAALNSSDNALTSIALTELTTTPITTPATIQVDPSRVITLCKEIGEKLGSVSTQDCLESELKDSGGRSLQDRSLALRDFLPKKETESLGRVLLIGGIHGDEYSAVSIVFKWIHTLRKNHSGTFQWRIAPLSNPDGLLRPKSQRQNHAGVDLNRNFPTSNWEKESKDYWEKRTYKNPRRYPGPKPASEPETQWLIQQIEEFQPDAIVAVHAPHSLVDYDGPQTPPEKLGSLQLLRLGIYPGSLGNYAGITRKIPVVTIELSSAGIMPPNKEVKKMWGDLVAWLKKEVPKQRLANKSSP